MVHRNLTQRCDYLARDGYEKIMSFTYQEEISHSRWKELDWRWTRRRMLTTVEPIYLC